MSQIGGHERGEGSPLKQAALGISLVAALAAATMVVAWLIAVVVAAVW